VSAAADPTHLRERLVDRLVGEGHVTAPWVEAAFRRVPRHVFLPGLPPAVAYRDDAIPTKRIAGRVVSSSSQPAIMAVMLEQLGVAPGHRVLEIGAGTGYNAALLDEIVGPGGEVTTVDIDEDLAEAARAHLAAAGRPRVRVVCADGAHGHPPRAPYDRIIVTVGAWEVAPAWPRQLVAGGRLVLPLSVRGTQLSVAFIPDGTGLRSISAEPCGFMPMRGALAGPGRDVALASDVVLSVDDRRPLNVIALSRALGAPGESAPSGVGGALGREAFGSLGLWLALESPEHCRLGARLAEGVEESPVPRLVEWPAAGGRQRASMGLVGARGLAALGRRRDERPAAPDSPAELVAHGLGADEGLVERLVHQVRRWHAAGRPGLQRVRITSRPLGAVGDGEGAWVVPKRRSELLVWT